MPGIGERNIKDGRVVLLAGGVGGAKLADGLAQILAPEQLTVIVNTGDDFQHLGLTICPDLDTVMYTLAGVANQETGWGRAGESWRVITELGRLGGPDWFRLGDLDLALHLARTEMLAAGETLTAVTRQFAQTLNVAVNVLPMCNVPAPTFVEVVDGLLPFQVWFVRQGWQPAVKEIHLPGDVRATHSVIQALETADIVLIAPSNPFVSIDPILNVYPIRAMLMDLPQVVVAVTPIIRGNAVKGPAAKMMTELGLPVTAAAVGDYYADLIDGFVIDRRDQTAVVESGRDYEYQIRYTDTLMVKQTDRIRLARDVLAFAGDLMKE